MTLMTLSSDIIFSIRNNKIDIVNDIPYEDLDTILKHVENDNFDSLEELGKGSYSKVYGYKDYAIKKLSDNYDFNSYKCWDVDVLKALGHLKCIPKLYAVINDSIMIVERIKGATISQFVDGNYNKDDIVMDELFVTKYNEALINVILSGYNPDDLHEHNVMIEAGTNEPKFVDVGWFYKHCNTYEPDNTYELERNEGYARAQMWSGYKIKNYVFG